MGLIYDKPFNFLLEVKILEHKFELRILLKFF